MATFKTVKKSNVVIVQQPVVYYERYTSGANVGKVKRKRMIQYVEDLDTIFVDEQRKVVDNPKPTPIYINKSNLMIEDDNVTKIELMTIHPHNTANGGTLFFLLDVDKEEVLELGNYKTTHEAVSLILEANDNEVRAVAIWFLGKAFLNKTPSKIKIVLKQKIEGNIEFAKEVISFLNEKNNEEKLLVTLALNENIIRIAEGKKIVWDKSNEVIFIGTQPNDVIREFSVWIKNDEEGRLTLKALTDKLGKTKK